ncbi:MAG: gamma-glutamylcyclotransferase family protein [Cyanobacteria bacterium J06649_4]
MNAGLKEEDARDQLCVFVYGTLKPGGRYHERYCGAYTPKLIPAAVRGQLFDFPHLGYPAMADGERWVKGYLLVFSQPPAVCATLLGELDRLEGYQPNSSVMDSEYERCWLDVFDRSGRFLQQAWVYRMAMDAIAAAGGIPIPHGNWPVS